MHLLHFSSVIFIYNYMILISSFRKQHIHAYDTRYFQFFASARSFLFLSHSLSLSLSFSLSLFLPLSLSPSLSFSFFFLSLLPLTQIFLFHLHPQTIRVASELIVNREFVRSRTAYREVCSGINHA